MKYEGGRRKYEGGRRKYEGGSMKENSSMMDEGKGQVVDFDSRFALTFILHPSSFLLYFGGLYSISSRVMPSGSVK